MEGKFNVQADRGQYYNGRYDDLFRFISYYSQIDLVRSAGGKEVLEIGIGNKTVSNYLTKHGFKITTCDFDAKLGPDVVADVRELPFPDASFDTVVACEILEHIPWKDVPKALGEIRRVVRRHAVVSIPYPSAYLEFIFKAPLMNRLLKRPFIRLFAGIPLFFSELKFSGDHYWEMGRKGCPAGKVREEFRKKFEIEREMRAPLDTYHYFFLLRKR